VVVYLGSEEVHHWTDLVINEAETKHENIKKIKESTDKLIKEKGDALDKMIDHSSASKIKLDDIFTHYYTRLNKHDDVVSDVIHALKSKFFNQITKYTNDFVENSKIKNAHSIYTHPVSPTRKFIKKSTSIFSQFNLSNNIKKDHSESKMIEISKNNSVSNVLNAVTKIPTSALTANTSVNLNDSCQSKEIVRIEDNSKKKKKNYFGYNKKNKKEEYVTDIYKRLVDLNSLENKIFKTSQNEIENNQYAEMLYNLKKKV
jgi:hypothetical protein